MMQSFLVSLCNQAAVRGRWGGGLAVQSLGLVRWNFGPEVSMLSEDETDNEVMQRLAPLSRSIQDFIAGCLGSTAETSARSACKQVAWLCFGWFRGCARYTKSDSDVALLTEEWLCGTFSLCARKAGSGQRLASMCGPQRWNKKWGRDEDHGDQGTTT